MMGWRRVFGDERSIAKWAAAAVAAIVFLYGLVWHQPVLLGVGAVMLCFVLKRISNGSSLGQPHDSAVESQAAAKNRWATAGSESGAEGLEGGPGSQRDDNQPRKSWQSTGAFVEDLLSNNRYALLLRPETKQHLTQSQLLRAVRQLDDAMALVPAGRVLLGQLAEQSHAIGGNADMDPKLASRNLVNVQPAYLDRYCVTNEDYQRFVDAGGYEQLEFWHEEALPALLDFVDQTGCPGPRFWADGEYPIGEHRLPVVGVSWFEAWAYARWVGKRLPTDAEWTKAGAWPVESTPGRIAQRRYPWGESFDVRRACLFGTGNRMPVPVDEYPGGVSVGGIHQLIGNVWEWTASPLASLGDPTLHVSESVMSIRGGAFDTYFENHATCHYQSGEQALSRKANIGFRLALPMCDLEEQVSQEPELESGQAENQTVDEELAASC